MALMEGDTPGAVDAPDPPGLPPPYARVTPAGKFFTRGDDKFFLKGVTYGPFNPATHGSEYHHPRIVEADFAAMAAAGVNGVRVYTAPPRWLLDIAAVNGLSVMAGIPWTQHVAFLDNPELVADSYRLIDDAMTRLGGHPALLAISIGNEIPAPVVRWYGHQRIERHLRKLARRVKSADPHALVTYANYPTTEYLDLPFLDFVSFNVYLDAPDRFDAYLSRLQNIAGERPLVFSEIGMDSVPHTEPRQAAMLAQKIDAIFGGGSAGMFVFSWTDEWHRHGSDINDWKFGLVDRDRRPRIALDAVSAAYDSAPKPGWSLQRPPVAAEAATPAPRVSVIICSYNGTATIAETLRHTLALDYPDFEVIVVDDGSTDDVAAVAAAFPVKLIRQPNLGLSAARNGGLQAATGRVVAYIDDDAYPDAHWLTYLVGRMTAGDVVGAGGPNLAVPTDCPTAECVAHTPGGPTHVLLDDTVAEHIPGCNMAFYRDALLAVGGFDPRFRIAGDDVDVCWRLQNAGGILGFSPAAQVWHHRRNRVRSFWRQQVNYGKAEAELERKWPDKYNAAGHVTWAGRLYGKGSLHLLFTSRRRVYHGVWGEALFQQVYHVSPGFVASLPMMPEWYVLQGLLLVSTCLGIVWWPLLFAAVLLAIGVTLSAAQALNHGRRAILGGHHRPVQRIRMRLMIAALYRLQPLARFVGRYRGGLTPWRLTGVRGFAPPLPATVQILVPKWKLSSEWLTLTEAALRRRGASVIRGTDFDRWDLELRGNASSSVRAKLMTEDMGDEKQLVRWRITPRCSPAAALSTSLAAMVSLTALARHHHVVAIVFAAAAAVGITVTARGCGAAMATFRNACAGGPQ